VLNPKLLEDHRATRTYLMQHCLEARRYLGREPLALEPPALEPTDDGDEGPAGRDGENAASAERGA
jgi:hypothetical protein